MTRPPQLHSQHHHHHRLHSQPMRWGLGRGMCGPAPLRMAQALLILSAALTQVTRCGAWIWPAIDASLYEEHTITWASLGLRSFDSFPGGPRCGQWHRNYTNLHRLIRQGSANWVAKRQRRQEPTEGAGVSPAWRRFATFTCEQGSIRKCGGLGDVMLGIVSTFLVALLQNRAFVVDHPLLHHAFEPGVIDWKMAEDVPSTPTFSVSKEEAPEKVVQRLGGEERVAGAVVDVDLLNVLPEEMESFFEPLHDAANLRIRWNRGILTKLLLFDLEKQGGPNPSTDNWTQLLHELGVRLPTAFGCFLKFIMRPKPQIYRMAKEELRELDRAGVQPGSSICIHVRTPDEQTWDPSGEAEVAHKGGIPHELVQWAEDKVMTCAKKIEDFWFQSPPQDVKWVLLSSSRALKMALKRAHHKKVYITGTNPTHTALRQDVPGRILAFKTTAAEWLVYTRCSLYLMTESGFSKTAALYSGRPFSIFLLARKYYQSKRNEWKDVCEPVSPASYTLLGARWSGI